MESVDFKMYITVQLEDHYQQIQDKHSIKNYKLKL